MPIKYRIDILAALKQAGYSSYRLRRDRIMGESNLQDIRNGKIVSIAVLEKICRLLDCQPGDILMYEDEQDK